MQLPPDLFGVEKAKNTRGKRVVMPRATAVTFSRIPAGQQRK